MLSEGNALGIFQLESDGMRNLLTKLKPRNLEDIISVISLYRPGPALSIDTFLKNRLAPEKIEYDHPCLKEILDSTCGVMLYQEQVMQVCRKLAGYSYGRADIVRRAMAKKKQDVMAKEKDIFLEGANKNGVSTETAEKVFDKMAEFAKYAFNKSHAAAYAVVAYRTAWLKCHYPREYMCSLLNTVMGYNEKVGEYISDCARMGIKILPPRVNHSYGSFSVEGNDLRFGLAAIKNVGALFADKVINERRAKKFSSLEDFLTRCASFGSIKTFESLVNAGALDEFGWKRSHIMSGLANALETVTKDKRNNSEGQMSLFGGNTSVDETVFEFPKSTLPELQRSEILRGEKEMTGLYFSGHPLDGYGDIQKQINALTVSEIREGLESGKLKKNNLIKFVGLVTKKRSKVTKKNDIMAFVTAEDESGDAELVVFPTLYAESGNMIEENKVLVFTGNPEIKEVYGEEGADNVTILLKSVQTPDEALKNAPKKPPVTNKAEAKSLYIKVTPENAFHLDDAVALASQSAGDSRILVYFEAEKRLAAAKGKTTNPTERLVNQLKALMGDENIAIK